MQCNSKYAKIFYLFLGLFGYFLNFMHYAMNIMNTDVPAPKSVDDILAEAMKGGK